MKKIGLLFLCLAVLLSAKDGGGNVTIFADNQISSTAKASVVIEATTKRVLFEKEKDMQLPMASTTKIMTALVALENTQNLDEVFDVDNRAVGIEGTSIYLKKNEHLSMRDLLLGLMLASGNDASLAIAYKIGNGNLQNFVDMMNKKASDLSLKNTHFDNPHGLDSKTHYTSAYDLACITAYAMQNKDFREIVSTRFAQIPDSKQGKYRFLKNKHRLLQNGFDGCEGVKTGFTDNARRCCVTSVLRNNMRLICVVLNCQDMFEDSKKQIDWCFEKYKMYKLLEANKYVDSIQVENGKSESVKTYTRQEFAYPLAESEAGKINSKYIIEKSLEAPVEKNQEVGTFKIYFDKDLIFETKVYTIDSVDTKDYAQKLKDIVNNWY